MCHNIRQALETYNLLRDIQDVRKSLPIKGKPHALITDIWVKLNICHTENCEKKTNLSSEL